MKKLGLLLALALIAGSASANIVLTDAQWSMAAEADDGMGSALTLPGTDFYGDPGYRFEATIVPHSDWGWGSLVGYTQVSVGMGGAAPDTWQAIVKNTHATSSVRVQLVGWVSTNGVAGGGEWIYQQTGIWTPELAPGESYTLNWDIAAWDVLDNWVPTGDLPTAIDSLALMIAGTAAGGTNLSVSILAEAEPEDPGPAPDELVLTDAQLQTLVSYDGSVDAVVDLPGDPGVEVQFTSVTNAANQPYQYNYVWMGDTTEYGGIPWTITFNNPSATASIVCRPFAKVDGVDTYGTYEWLSPGQTYARTMTIPAGTLNAVGFITELNNDWGGSVADGGFVTGVVQVVENPPDELILYDADLQNLTYHWGAVTINNIDDSFPEDPGTEIDLSIDLSSAVQEGLQAYIPLDLAVYAGNPWSITVANTNAFKVQVAQQILSNDWSYVAGESLWMEPDSSHTFTMDVPENCQGAGLNIQINSDWAGAPAGQVVDLVVQVVETPDTITEVELLDADWQTASYAGVGGGVPNSDIAGDPGIQMDVDVDVSSSFYVGMGGTSSYGGLPWNVGISNPNAFDIKVKQVALTNGWGWAEGNGGAFTEIPAGGNIPLSMTLPVETLDGLALIVERVDAVGGVVPIQIVPAVFLTPTEFYAEWAGGYSELVYGDTDIDFDLDGADNLLEYALGGNPVVADAASIQPESGFPDVDNWVYVYQRRSDASDRGLIYDLQYKTDLILDPSWIPSVGNFITGIGVVDAEFEAVTNSIPITLYGLEKAFLKLEVTESF